jgi:putative protease
MKILSPAGSYEAMVAAVKLGADGVYLGLNAFSARHSAKNFTIDTLKDAVIYCHKRGVEVFVALNTLIYDNEIAQVKKLIEGINSSMADGVIVQDMGVFSMVSKIAPELKIIASTQMTVNNISGVKLLEEKGFDTVVLPRELTSNDILSIKEHTNINLEIFAHGALCVCYSGQCLMSSFIGERSGNRGKCAQPCRMVYQTQHKQGYFLSPCDLSLINRLNDIESIGVDTIKIEGRLKSEYYTAAITDVYRRVLDSDAGPQKEDYDTITASFFRGGYTTGYFDNINDRQLFNFAKNENPYSKETEKLDKYYKQILSKNIEFSKIPVKISLDINIDKNVMVKLYFAGQEYSFSSKTIPVPAKNAPITKEKLIEQLDKTGNETFFFENIDINMNDENIFITISDINNIRREISLQINKIFDKTRENRPFSYHMQKRKAVNNLEFFATVRNAYQIKWIKEAWDIKVFARMATIDEYEKKYGKLSNIGLVCDRIVSDKEMNNMELFLGRHTEIKDLLIGNMGYINKFKGKYNLYGDFSLNIANSLSAEFFIEEGLCNITASVEANIKNIKNIMTKDKPLSVVGYGKIPLMITESCIKSNIRGKCNKAPLLIKDRKGEEFIIECENCSKNAIYNPYPIMMADKLNDVRASGINQVRLNFLDENKAELEEIILAFKLEQNPLTKFTRGHFYRGAY